MRYVKQKHINGCASAAIAMLTNHGYMKVFRIFQPIKKPFYGGLKYRHLLWGLKQLNIEYQISRSKKDLFKYDSIIVVKLNSKASHALVWDHSTKHILDPAKHIWPPVNFSKRYCINNFKYIIKLK